MIKKHPRRNTTAAALTLASAFACSGHVHGTNTLTSDEERQVEAAIEFIEGPGLDFAEALIDHTGLLFDHHRAQSSGNGVKESVQQTIEIVKQFYREGKILSWDSTRPYGGAYEGPKRDQISINFEESTSFIPVVVMHEAGHHLSDTFYEAGHFLVGQHGHARELKGDALIGFSTFGVYTLDGDWEGFSENVIKHKDFPYLMNILFFLQTHIRNQWQATAERRVIEISSYESNDTPQKTYDSLLKNRDYEFRDPCTWSEDAFLHGTQSISSIPFYMEYFYEPIGFDEKTVMEIAAMTLFDTVLEDWNDVIQMYVDTFPDEAIETEQERSERQVSKPEFRKRLR